MTGSDIQTKIFNFTLDHLEYFGKQDSVVLAAMVKEGIITQAELEQYKKIGLFGFGFGMSEDIGLSVEQTTPRVSSAGAREETPSAPRVSPAEYSQVRDFALDQLYDNVDVALKTLEKYKKDFGYISFDAVDHGLRQIADWVWTGITGRNDIKTIHERINILKQLLSDIDDLRNNPSMSNARFESKFEQIVGFKFDPNAFKELRDNSKDFQVLNSNKLLIERMQSNINTLKSPDMTVDKARVFVASLFGNDLVKTNEYISQLLSQYESEAEVLQAIVNDMEKIKATSERTLSELFLTKSEEKIKNDYKNSLLKVFSNKDWQKEIESYIQNAQISTMAIEMATTMYIMGLAGTSKTFTNIAGKATAQIATKTSSTIAPKIVEQGVKAGFTTMGAMISPTETMLSGITSENGITDETLAMAGEQARSGLIFGAFGSYVSAPMGDKLVGLLKSNSSVTNALIQKVFSGVGFTTEVGMDAVFELIVNGGEISSLLAENAGGEALGRMIQMLVGGQAYRATKDVMSNVKLEQKQDVDGSIIYLVKDSDGKVYYETRNPEEIFAGIISVASESSDEQTPKVSDIDTEVGKTVPFDFITDLDFSRQAMDQAMKNDLTNSLSNEYGFTAEELRGLTPEELSEVYTFMQKTNKVNYKYQAAVDNTYFDFKNDVVDKALQTIDFGGTKSDITDALQVFMSNPRFNALAVQFNGAEYQNVGIYEIKNEETQTKSISTPEQSDEQQNPQMLSADELNSDDLFGAIDFSDIGDVTREANINEILNFGYDEAVLKDLSDDALSLLREMVRCANNIDFIHKTILEGSDFDMSSDFAELSDNAKQVVREKLSSNPEYSNIATRTFTDINSPINGPSASVKVNLDDFTAKPSDFTSIISKRVDDIRNLNTIENDQVFYENFYKIIAEEMGLGDLAPKLDFEYKHENARATYSDFDNTLYIARDNFPKDRATGVGIIMHELKHFMQFRDELLLYSDNKLDGLLNLSMAKAEDLMRKNPNLDLEDATDQIYRAYFDSEGNLKPHVMAILDNCSAIDPDSPRGLNVNQYLENEAKYIDKTESLENGGTLELYHSQITETEAYEVGDAVASFFSKEVLGVDRIVNTREVSIESPVLRTTKTELSQSVPSTGLTVKDINMVYDKLCKKYYDAKYNREKFFENFDYENADRHLSHLEILLSHNSNRLGSIIEKGYFSSKEGADALTYALSKYSVESKPNGHISDIDNLLQSVTPQELLIAKSRDITDIKQILKLKELSDEDFLRWQSSPYKENLNYVSTNDNINKILCQIKETSVKNLKKIEKSIMDEITLNPSQEAEILRFYEKFFEFLEYDSFDIINNLKEESISIYKKAYQYLKDNNLTDCKMVILDTNTSNLYNKSGIEDFFTLEQRLDTWAIVFFDKDGNYIRTDRATTSDIKNVENITNQNGQIKYDANIIKIDKTKTFLEGSSKDVFDSAGTLIYTEKYQKSTAVDGKYDIIREYPDGKKYKIGLAEVSPAGDVVIEKTLVSETGVKTDYNYLETTDGSRLSNTKITDAKGNVIFQNKYQYKVIDENHFVTIENGVKYDIEFKKGFLGSSVIVTRSDGKTVKISLGSNSIKSSAVLSEDLLPLLKQMPGSFYFDIDKFNLSKIGLGINNVYENNAHYCDDKNLIAISEEWKDGFFTLAHEFGHYRDEFLKISSDPEVFDIYMRERKALIENQSQFEARSLHYFIDANCRRTESVEGSISEITAEINAFLYASNIDPSLELRGQLLQQYFPETFAIISNKLTQRP